MQIKWKSCDCCFGAAGPNHQNPKLKHATSDPPSIPLRSIQISKLIEHIIIVKDSSTDEPPKSERPHLLVSNSNNCFVDLEIQQVVTLQSNLRQEVHCSATDWDTVLLKFLLYMTQVIHQAPLKKNCEEISMKWFFWIGNFYFYIFINIFWKQSHSWTSIALHWRQGILGI